MISPTTTRRRTVMYVLYIVCALIQSTVASEQFIGNSKGKWIFQHVELSSQRIASILCSSVILCICLFHLLYPPLIYKFQKVQAHISKVTINALKTSCLHVVHSCLFCSYNIIKNYVSSILKTCFSFEIDFTFKPTGNDTVWLPLKLHLHPLFM